MNRPHTISIWALALLGALTSCRSAPQTSAPSNPTPTSSASSPQTIAQPHYTYVLVHGAWAGAWEWKHVGELLQADGNTVYRPTLTGQGERVHLATPDTDLNTHITDVVNTILFENLHDIVLMGHSYGGMVITGVADRVPDRIKALVYVDAILPNDGESANVALGRPPRPTTSPFLTPPGGWPPPQGKLPPYIVPQPAKTLNQPISLTNPASHSIPVTYILTVDRGRAPEQDTFFKSYQRAKERGWTTWIMEGDHVVNVTHPVELTKLLEQAPAAASPGPTKPSP
ncbi:MAG TPA: alpha/beta hydrolase [Tepidisphaeraceae bacterium]|jgi:pimeloyl-ACP methyl ester carboxylesterase|nr:alpha/beta hydrolase [Tepidisphaeraceae bacterium]